MSDFIENYLKILTKEEQKNRSKKLNLIVESLRGSFKMPKNMDYKKELRNRKEEKYS
jgi:dGTP triphosphohydrolase